MVPSENAERGRYDVECEQLLNWTRAEVAFLCVLGGNRGSGFSLCFGLHDQGNPERILELFDQSLVQLKTIANERIEVDRPAVVEMVAKARKFLDEQPKPEAAPVPEGYADKVASILDRLADGLEKSPDAVRVEVPGVGSAVVRKHNPKAPQGSLANPGPYSYLDRLESDEPFFLLRAKDPIAGAIVSRWVQLARETGAHDPEKCAEALELAGRMSAWLMRQAAAKEQALRDAERADEAEREAQAETVQSEEEAAREEAEFRAALEREAGRAL